LNEAKKSGDSLWSPTIEIGAHARGGELPQSVVHERQQVGHDPAVTGRGSIKEARHLGHDGRAYQLMAPQPPENEGDRAFLRWLVNCQTCLGDQPGGEACLDKGLAPNSLVRCR